jgi:uncharacterized protein (TIGR03435 family)
MLYLRLAAVAVTLVSCAMAEKPPAFDVASVKANHSPDQRGGHVQFLPGGRLSVQNIVLSAIISFAYDVPINPSIRLNGLPDWTRTARFDIEATTDKASLPPDLVGLARIRKMKLMLQTLLADRFHMQVRTETREMPLYALVIGKSGPKLKPAKIQESDCADPEAVKLAMPCHEVMGGMGRGLHAKAVDVSDIAHYVENWSDRPVVDKTGLTGLFEIDTEGWTPMTAQPPREATGGGDEGLNDPDRHTIFLVFDRLGLKLEQQRGPVQIYTIEHVEKLSEN